MTRERSLTTLGARANPPARLPAMPTVRVDDPQMQRFVNAVAEWIEVRSGSRGDGYERAITLRDLVDFGVVDPGSVSRRGTAAQPESFVAVETGRGRVPMTIDAFAQSIMDTALFKALMARLNDPGRFDNLPERVRSILQRDIADEARKRGADVQRMETKIQTSTESFAAVVQEVTASVGEAIAGVRTTAYAAATQASAAAGQVTQVRAALGDPDTFTGAGVTIEQTLFGSATLEGLIGQYTVKIDAGGKIAGVGLAVDAPVSGPATSAFIIAADKFAIVSPSYSGGLTLSPSLANVPFGVDSTGVYIKGQVRINANGTPLDDLINTGNVRLESTSAFWKVDSAGAAVNSTVTLTAVKAASLPAGFVTWTAEPSGQGGTPPTGTNTWTINAADQTVDAATYTATFVDGSDTYTDSLTVVRLRDGANAIQAVLTNEAHTVPADSAGAVADYTGAGGTMQVYRGTTLLTSGVTYSVQSNTSGLTASINSTTGVYSVTATGTWPDASSVATITFRAAVGGVNLDKVFTLSKARAGTAGSIGVSARTARITSTANAFRVSKLGVFSPSSITLTAQTPNLSELGAITYAWTTSPNIASGTSSTFTITSGTFGAQTAVQVTLTATAGGTPFVDTFTILRVEEGVDSVQAALTNESHTLAADALGSISSYTGASGQFVLFRGGVDVTSSATFSVVNSTGFSTAPSTSITAGGAYSITGSGGGGIISAAADVATVTYRATFGGTGYDKIFSITKAKAGDVGPAGSASTLTLSTTEQVFFTDGTTNSPASVTLTAAVANIPGPVFTWRINGVTQPPSGSTLTVPYFAPGSNRVIRCDAVGSDLSTAFDVMTLYSIRNGSDAFNAGLENENQTVACDSGGTPLAGQLPMASRMIVVKGATVLASGVTYAVESATNLTGAFIGPTSGVITVAGISADAGSATFTATVAGGPVLRSTFTANKSRNGLVGQSTYAAMIFRRSATAPTAPTGGSFDFGSNTLSPPAGWDATVPAGTDQLYVSQFTFAVSGSTGTAPGGTWSTPRVQAVNGLPGTPGTSTYLMPIFIRASSTPATPAPGSGGYNFGTNTGTAPAGWSTAIPAGTLPVYTSSALMTVAGATGLNTNTPTWSAPALLATNGVNGQDGPRGSLTGYSASVVPPIHFAGPTWSGATDNANASAIIWKMLGFPGLPASTSHLRVGDTVTLTNSAGTRSETRFWDGFSTWLPPGVRIDGNLLVIGTVAADKINTPNLSAINSNLGTITAGDYDGSGYINARGQTTLAVDPLGIGSTATVAIAGNASGTAEIGVYGRTNQTNGSGVYGWGPTNGFGATFYGGDGILAVARRANGFGGRFFGFQGAASTAINASVNNSFAGSVAVNAQASSPGQIAVLASSSSGTALSVQGAMTINNATLVANLNANFVGGFAASAFAQQSGAAVVLGAITPGGATISFNASNKPGTYSGGNTWMLISINGSFYTFPIWQLN
jgi:hypothetical protein